MGFVDDLLGLPGGTSNDVASELFGPAYDAAGQFAQSVWGVGGSGPTSAAGAGGAVGYGDGAYAGGAAGGAGATMDWSSLGIPAGLSLSGPRRIIPYTGGIIPQGYRVANRKARRGSPGYQAGTYLVPRRRMNPLNPHALMRAERRMASFTHWVKRHFRIAAHCPPRKRKARCYRRKR